MAPLVYTQLTVGFFSPSLTREKRE